MYSGLIKFDLCVRLCTGKYLVVICTLTFVLLLSGIGLRVSDEFLFY